MTRPAINHVRSYDQIKKLMMEWYQRKLGHTEQSLGEHGMAAAHAERDLKSEKNSPEPPSKTQKKIVFLLRIHCRGQK